MKLGTAKKLSWIALLSGFFTFAGESGVAKADVETIDYTQVGPVILNANTTEANILTGANIGGLISGGSSAGVTYKMQGGSLNALQTSIGGDNDINISGGTMTVAPGSDVLSLRGVDFIRMTGGTLTGNINAGNATGTALIYIDGGVLNGDIHDSPFSDQMLIRGNAVINGEWYEQNGSDLLVITNNARLNGGIHGGNGGDILRIEENAVVTGTVNLEGDSDQVFVSGNSQVNGSIFSGGGNDIFRVSGTARTLSGINMNLSGTQSLFVSDQATVGWIVAADSATSYIYISDQAHIKTDGSGGLSLRTDNHTGNNLYFTMTGGTLDGGMRMIGGTHEIYISGGSIGTTPAGSQMAMNDTSIEFSSANDLLQMTGGTLLGGVNGAHNTGTLNIFVGGVSQIGVLPTGDSIIGGTLNSQITIADQAQLAGNVQSNSGGSVLLTGGTVAGNVLIGNAGTVNQTGGSVLGSILTSTGGATVTLAGGNVAGNLQGGAGDDHFIGAGGTLGGMISGGAGNDLLQVTNGTYRVDDMENMDISGGLALLNQTTYQNLTTSGKGVVQLSSGNTVFSGDVVHGGVINLAANGVPTDSFSVIGNYVGQSGLFRLNAIMDLSSSSVDQLLFSGPVNGVTYLEIKGTAPSTLTPLAPALVVDTMGSTLPDNTFRLKNPQVQVGFHNYALVHEGSQWILRSVGISPVVLGYNKNLLGNYNLTRELLDFSKESKEDWNPWARYIGKSYELSTSRRSYGANLHGFQAGIDKRVYQSENEMKAAYFGAFAGYGRSTMDYGIKNNGEATGEGWHGGLYGIYDQKINEKNRFHLDGAVLWGRQGDMENISGLSGAHEKYDADLWGANLNTYYSIASGGGWRWEPGISLSYGNVKHGGSFSEDSGLRVQDGEISGLYGALNVKLMKEQTTKTGHYFAPYIKGEIGTNLSGGDARTDINGIVFREQGDDLSGSIGIGFVYEASKRHRWSFEVNRLMGAEQGWQGSGMIQFYW